MIATIFGSLFSNEVMISYFEKATYAKNHIHLEDTITNIEKKDIDAGFMLSLSYPINDPTSVLSILGGTSIARWEVPGDETYGYSTFLAARLIPLSMLGTSPFVELSLAGPTYLSKGVLGDIDFGSNIVYQNYVAIGVKAFSVVADIKMINYCTSLPAAFTKNSITMPLILSIGLTF
jgi:hypothetical protein